MACFVFKPLSRGRKSRYYSAKVKLDGWSAPRVIALRVQDKSVAEEKARALVNDLERQSLGLPSLFAIRKASQTALAPHLAAYVADVEARGRAAGTVRAYRVILGHVFKCAKWSTPADITAHSFCLWRSDPEVSAKYANNVLGYARTFLTWLVKKRVLAVNVLADVEKIRVRGDRGARYAPTLTELTKFLETAPLHRATVYLFTIYTGLRRSELDGLTWGDIDLDSTTPSVRVSGSISKNGKTETLPLRPEVVDALRAYRPDMCQPFEWAFRGRVPKSRTVKKDIIKAGILPRDSYGRRFDLHALRTTFGTLLSASGVLPRVAMQMMRHSEISLTMKTYMDASHLPLVSSLAMLPALSLHASKHVSKLVVQGQNGAFPDVSCHFLASSENLASVSAGLVSSVQVASGEVLKMVGTERFELSTSTTRM